MRDRRRLQKLVQLVAVQRARRGCAEDSLRQARDREEQARKAEREALDRSETAHRDWLALISAPAFSPELSQALAHRLVGLDGEAQGAAARSAAAAEVSARRQREWQELEAQVRSGDGSVKRLDRRVRRSDEERRLGERADLTTYSRCRP